MTAPRIIIVHGIHTNDHAAWMTTIRDAFGAAGFDVLVWTYGYAYALLTRIQNPGRAKKLKALIGPDDIVLGHSNGCCLAWLAAQAGAQMAGAVFLNPALDRDKAMPEHVPWVNLYPNHADIAVEIALIFRKHPWGDQGQHGLAFNDRRYLTRFTDEEFGRAPPVFGHSAVLEPAPLAVWSQVFVHDVLHRLGDERSVSRAA